MHPPPLQKKNPPTNKLEKEQSNCETVSFSPYLQQRNTEVSFSILKLPILEPVLLLWAPSVFVPQSLMCMRHFAMLLYSRVPSDGFWWAGQLVPKPLMSDKLSENVRPATLQSTLRRRDTGLKLRV